jgi:hypothetical protein
MTRIRCAVVCSVLAGCSGAVSGDESFADACGGIFYSPNATCYAPGECCDLGGADLESRCEEAFPGHPVPVMCMDDMPVGLDCQRLDKSQFMCEWGTSALTCCQTSE